MGSVHHEIAELSPTLETFPDYPICSPVLCSIIWMAKSWKLYELSGAYIQQNGMRHHYCAFLLHKVVECRQTTQYEDKSHVLFYGPLLGIFYKCQVI